MNDNVIPLRTTPRFDASVLIQGEATLARMQLTHMAKRKRSSASLYSRGNPHEAAADAIDTNGVIL